METKSRVMLACKRVFVSSACGANAPKSEMEQSGIELFRTAEQRDAKSRKTQPNKEGILTEDTWTENSPIRR